MTPHGPVAERGHMSPRKALLALLTTGGMGLPTAALAESFTVGPSTGADYAGIDAALSAATPGEDLTIALEDGTWPTVTVHRSGRTEIVKFDLADATIDGIRVTSSDAEVTVQQVGIGSDGAYAAQGSLTLTGLAIQRTLSPTVPEQQASAPALHAGAGATVRAEQVLVSHWHGGDAPIVLEPGSTAELETVGVFASSGSRAGAVWSQQASFSAVTLYAIDTFSTAGTGALELDGGSVNLADCDFDSTTGALAGAIRIVNDATVTAQDIMFLENSAVGGAAIRLESGNLTLVRSYAQGGSADQGGVLWMDGGTADVRNADWSQNRATSAGGTVYQSGGTLSVGFSTWTGAVSSQGAGLYARGGSATMNGVLITDTEGAALVADSDASVDFVDGLLWNIGADVAATGVATLEVNRVFRDPAFKNVDRADYALTTDSPALDLGIGGLLDPDGTAADAGMFGGPDAWPLADMDGDGFVYGRDCHDGRADVYEGAPDAPYDGIDANCDGASDFDQDGDGFDSTLYAGGDCDDTDPEVHPDASESNADGVDADCDGFDHVDADEDGWPSDLDCDDTDNSVRPDAEDAWYDGVDADCAGNDDFDQDGDGYASDAYGGADCDDLNAKANPGRMDSPDDGIDQDCSGSDATSQPTQEDEVTTVSPAQESQDSAAGTRPMLSTQSTTSGCSSAGKMGSGAWGLMLLGLVGLVGRRR